MADLLAILSQGANGLAAFRAATQTASHNLANVNTPGYSRQRAELEAMPGQFWRQGSFLGNGVTLAAVTQSRDAFLERQIPASFASRAQHNAESETLRAISAFDPEAAGGIAQALSGYYGALRMLSQNPGDAGLRASVVAAGRNLALAFNRTSSALDAARSGVDASLTADVQDANAAAAEIASLNVAIAKGRAQGAEPNDLLDRRRLAMDKLATLTGATAVYDDKGNVQMVLPGGAALVSGDRSATLSTAPDPANPGHLAVRITRIGASTPDSLTGPTGFGGRIRGLLDARDGTLGAAMTSLDQLAFDFGSAVNAQHQAGFALDGSAGQAFFSLGASAAGAAQTIAVNAAITADPRLIAASATAAGVPGNAGNVHALIATERQPLSGGIDVSSSFSALVTRFGSATRSAESLAAQDEAVAERLEGLRESTSGVSIDEEIVAMTQAQRAFEAVAKVIKTSDEMLNVLMQLK